ncbi:MAG: glycosyltransferase family 39 protein [Acidobacteriota bacterium]
MRRDRWFFFLVLALTVRFGFLLAVAHPEIRSGSFELRADTDESDYHGLALSLATTGEYRLGPDHPATAFRPPGTVLPIAALYRLLGPLPALGVLYVMVCSVLIVLLLGVLAHRISGSQRVTAIALLMACLMPTLVFTSTGIWSDTPALLFILLSLYLVLAERPPPRNLAVAGASLGLAYINRPSAGLLIALVGALLLREAWARRQLRGVVLFGLLAGLPILGWGMWNVTSLGKFFIGNTQSTVTLWQANNAVTAGLRAPVPATANGFDLAQEAAAGRYLGSWVPLPYIADSNPWSDRSLPELEAEDWLRQQVVDFIRENPAAYLRLLTYKGWRILTAEPTAPSVLAESPGKRRLKRLATFGERWLILLLGSYGMVLLWRRSPRTTLYHLVYLAAGLAVVFVAYPNARILLPVTAVLIVPTALAIAQLADRLGMWRSAPSAQAKP